MENVNQNQKWTKVSEIELVYRTKVKVSERPQIQSSNDAYQILLQNWNLNLIELQEEFKMLVLNRALRVLGIVNISRGSKSGTIADIGLILVTAIKAGASSVIIAHNHPSGRLLPSQPDIQLTRKLKMALDYHDIILADHLIITNEGYYSFVNQGAI